MKVKVSEATPLHLNWLVAVCEFPNPDYCYDNRLVYVTCELDYGMGTYSPSTDWSQGGPIIERERISVIDVDGYDFWKADRLNKEAIPVINYGPTPLIAAMRCYVASKLGDEVEIPKELI